MSAAVVLVHGAFVDGSGWRGVYDQLVADGLTVRVTQQPTLDLAGDAAAVRRVVDDISGPVMLVGHSYGGAVITEAGTHDSVVGLVYVTAFAPDAGESVNDLLSRFPADGAQPPILPPVDGFLLLDRAKFPASFAGDLPAADAAFLADAQQPWGAAALGDVITEPAWRGKPSWYLHVTDDEMIDPAGQQLMLDRMNATVKQTPGSHAIYVSNPTVVADLVREAVAAVS